MMSLPPMLAPVFVFPAKKWMLWAIALSLFWSVTVIGVPAGADRADVLNRMFSALMVMFPDAGGGGGGGGTSVGAGGGGASVAGGAGGSVASGAGVAVDASAAVGAAAATVGVAGARVGEMVGLEACDDAVEVGVFVPPPPPHALIAPANASAHTTVANLMCGSSLYMRLADRCPVRPTPSLCAPRWIAPSRSCPSWIARVSVPYARLSDLTRTEDGSSDPSPKLLSLLASVRAYTSRFHSPRVPLAAKAMPISVSNTHFGDLIETRGLPYTRLSTRRARVLD